MKLWCAVLSLVAGWSVWAEPGPSVNSKVSWIDRDVGPEKKITMMVDGKPFFPIIVELSINRFFNKDLFGWSDNEIEPILHQIKADGFTAVKLPFYWGQVETAKDQFDWHMIDRSIDFCVQADLPMILNWWGSEFCEVSWIYDGLLPAYVTTDYEYVTDKAGKRIEVNYHYSRDTRAYPKLDKCDDRLLEREAFVLKTLMDHIHDYIASKHYPNIVIGVQVQNEPSVVRMFGKMLTDRSYSASANAKWQQGGWTDVAAFREAVMFNYLNGLARAVKTSRYPVWTNSNFVNGADVPITQPNTSMAICISQNQVARAQGKSYLDFIGVDIYQESPDSFYNLLNDRYFVQGKNYVHIPETSASYRSLLQIHFNVLAGNGSLGIWEYLKSGDWAWANKMNLYLPRDDHSFSARDQAWLERVRAFNLFLLKNVQAFATLRAEGTHLKFFNRQWERFARGSKEVAGIVVEFKTVSGAGGIASKNPDGLALMATDYAVFTIDAPGVKSIEKGGYDKNNMWQKAADAEYETKDKKATIELRPLDCVRVVLE